MFSMLNLPNYDLSGDDLTVMPKQLGLARLQNKKDSVKATQSPESSLSIKKKQMNLTMPVSFLPQKPAF